MYLSIIIPAYNEARRIEKTLRAVDTFLKTKSYQSEIIVVNDGSKDKTADVVQKLTREIKNLRLIDMEQNGGKGKAVQQGILSSNGSYCLFTDADNSTAIEQVDKLLPYISEGYDVVISSRHVKGAKIMVPQPFLRVFLGTIFRLFVAGLIPTGIFDTQNGFKLFTRTAAFTIFSQQRVFRWAFDVEVLAIAKKLGFKIKEVGVNWRNDEASQMNLKGMINMIREVFQVRKNLWMGTYYRPVNIPNSKAQVSLVK